MRAPHNNRLCIKPDFRRMAAGLWGRQNDDGAPGQGHPSLRNNRNRKRQLENKNEARTLKTTAWGGSIFNAD